MANSQEILEYITEYLRAQVRKGEVDAQALMESVAYVFFDYDHTPSISTLTISEQTLKNVQMERLRQDTQWGESNHDDFTWLVILSEEIGEVSRAIMHDRFGGDAAGNVKRELIQVAAVAMAWLDCLERQAPLPRTRTGRGGGIVEYDDDEDG